MSPVCGFVAQLILVGSLGQISVNQTVPTVVVKEAWSDTPIARAVAHILALDGRDVCTGMTNEYGEAHMTCTDVDLSDLSGFVVADADAYFLSGLRYTPGRLRYELRVAPL